MALTLAQIRTFRRIVRAGSFAAAASALGVTQPSVSQRIRELESALGVRLFVRHGPRIRLTAEGEALVPYAERVVDTVDELFDRFRGRDPMHGLLRFAVTDSFALIALPDLLRRLEAHYPYLKTSVRVANGFAMGELLNEREIDVAIGAESDVEAHVGQEPLGRNELAWFAGTQFDVAGGVVDPKELAARHLIVVGPPSRLYRTVQDWFANLGLEPERMSTCNSLEVTARAVLFGHAVGLLPVRLMRDELAHGRVRRLTVLPAIPAMNVSIYYQIGGSSEPIRAVVDLSRQVVATHQLYV